MRSLTARNAVRYLDEAQRLMRARINGLTRQDRDTFYRWVAAAVFLGVVVVLITWVFTPSPPALTRISYSEFKKHLDNVASVTTTGRNLDGKMKVAESIQGAGSPVLSFTTEIPTYGDADLQALLERNNVTVNPGKDTFNWDVVLSATPFSTLAAILAGFVIIAIVAMLTFPPNAGEEKKQYAPLIPLLAAFFTLVLAAFLFSVLSGAGTTGGNRLLPLTEGYFLSWIFGCGVVQTCVGITWLMQDYKTSSGAEPVRETARWIVHLGVGLAAVATSGILVQPLFVLYANQESVGTIAWIGMGLLPILAVPIAGPIRRYWSPDHLKMTTAVAIVLTLIATVGYGAASAFTEQQVRGIYGPVFDFMVVMQVVLCGIFTAYEASLPILAREAREAQVQSTAAASSA